MNTTSNHRDVPPSTVRLLGRAFLTVAVVLVSARAQTVGHGVSAALIQVVQNDTNNTAASVTVTAPLAINDFRLRPDSNRGDYNVQIGDSAGDDVAGGILMSCVTEHLRDNGVGLGAVPGISAVDYNAGGYWIASFAAAGLAAGSNPEHNVNVAAAWFPYPQWLGAMARIASGANGSATVTNDVLVGHPQLVYGVHYLDRSAGGGANAGKAIVDLRSLGVDSRTDGILLVNGAKNESANFALSQPNKTNGTWNLFVRDAGNTGTNGETDPVAFLFIPKTNTTVISGRFNGDGSIDAFSGATPQFTVTSNGVGTYELKLSGRSPADGVLVISGEGGGALNYNNIVNYEINPAGDGWIIESRDTPSGALQSPGAGEGVVSFVFIPAAVTATLIEPANNAPAAPKSPELKVAVANDAPGNVTVNFYGRVASLNSAEFTIVALPDTQYYAATLHGGLPAMWFAQTEWILTHRVARNIVYVAHLGDIVEHGDTNGGNPAQEWANATNAMYRLEDPQRTLLTHGVPYGMAVGNHDQSPNGAPNGTTAFFNQYFGVPHFSGRPYYAGHYGTNNDNHFDFFSAAGMDFIVLYFEYDPAANPAVLAWGNDVLRTNQNRRAIVVTHYAGSPATPSNFSAQGAAIYNALKTNANFFLMLGGHVNGEGSRADTFNGRTVRTLISDYQFRTNGGNGFLRLMTFSPANDQVVVQTYSPWTDEYETDDDSEFWFPYDMTAPAGSNGAPFELLGTFSNVPPDQLVSLVWSNRQLNTAYEWYVTVTDALNTTTSPIWRFATAPNLAPSASNQLLTVTGDAPTNLTLTAYDPNGDALTFQTNSLPAHGLNLNFNPASGTLTYAPTRGFRGFDRFAYSASDGALTSAVVTLNLNVITPPDTNANGLPDEWEQRYGVTDPDADDDGDGLSNFAEYLANTNPTNANSALRITGLGRDATGHATLRWDSVGGTRYRVQFRDGDPNGVFNDLARPVGVEQDSAPYGTPAQQSFADDFTLTGGPATNTGRYFRIRLVQ